jgi:hypothetical protein
LVTSGNPSSHHCRCLSRGQCSDCPGRHGRLVSGGVGLSKPSRLALSRMAIACGGFPGACNDSARLQFLAVAHENGEIHGSAKPAEGSEGCSRRPFTSGPASSSNNRKAPRGSFRPEPPRCGSFEYAPQLVSARDPQKTGPAPPPGVPQAFLQPRFTMRGLLRNCARRGSVVRKTAYSP